MATAICSDASWVSRSSSSTAGRAGRRMSRRRIRRPAPKFWFRRGRLRALTIFCKDGGQRRAACRRRKSRWLGQHQRVGRRGTRRQPIIEQASAPTISEMIGANSESISAARISCGSPASAFRVCKSRLISIRITPALGVPKLADARERQENRRFLSNRVLNELRTRARRIWSRGRRGSHD